MSRSLFIGRWQPFHSSHRKLIQKVLDEGKSVLIAVCGAPIDKEGVYSAIKERARRIKKFYKNNPKVEVVAIPDIDEICYGRDVDWRIRRVRLDEQTEEMPTTEIRGKTGNIIWLTGNVGAGKTSLAYLLKKQLNAIVLDGDEMRFSISAGASFSKKDRHEHNLRVARLAKVLSSQGYNVVVSVIAPFAKTRSEIDKIINPFWVYIKGGEVGSDKPYEPPENPDCIVDVRKESLLRGAEKIIKAFSDARKSRRYIKKLKLEC